MNGTGADVLIARLTGERFFGKYTGGGRPRPDVIARLAFDLYEQRGREDGRDVDDWLRAERALMRRER